MPGYRRGYALASLTVAVILVVEIIAIALLS